MRLFHSHVRLIGLILICLAILPLCIKGAQSTTKQKQLHSNKIDLNVLKRAADASDDRAETPGNSPGTFETTEQAGPQDQVQLDGEVQPTEQSAEQQVAGEQQPDQQQIEKQQVVEQPEQAVFEDQQAQTNGQQQPETSQQASEQPQQQNQVQPAELQQTEVAPPELQQVEQTGQPEAEHSGDQITESVEHLENPPAAVDPQPQPQPELEQPESQPQGEHAEHAEQAPESAGQVEAANPEQPEIVQQPELGAQQPEMHEPEAQQPEIINSEQPEQPEPVQPEVHQSEAEHQIEQNVDEEQKTISEVAGQVVNAATIAAVEATKQSVSPEVLKESAQIVQQAKPAETTPKPALPAAPIQIIPQQTKFTDQIEFDKETCKIGFEDLDLEQLKQVVGNLLVRFGETKQNLSEQKKKQQLQHYNDANEIVFGSMTNKRIQSNIMQVGSMKINLLDLIAPPTTSLSSLTQSGGQLKLRCLSMDPNNKKLILKLTNELQKETEYVIQWRLYEHFDGSPNPVEGLKVSSFGARSASAASGSGRKVSSAAAPSLARASSFGQRSNSSSPHYTNQLTVNRLGLSAGGLSQGRLRNRCEPFKKMRGHYVLKLSPFESELQIEYPLMPLSEHKQALLDQPKVTKFEVKRLFLNHEILLASSGPNSGPSAYQNTVQIIHDSNNRFRRNNWLLKMYANWLKQEYRMQFRQLLASDQIIARINKQLELVQASSNLSAEGAAAAPEDVPPMRK